MVQLRPYQEELITGTRGHFRQGRKRVLIQLATGGGKTALTARMVANAAKSGRRVWFNVHRRELVQQVSQALTKEGVDHGLIVARARMNLDAAVQVCSIPTVVRRLERLPPPDMLVFDECHHVAAGSWSLLAQEFPDAYQIGLSATPQRLDGAGLGQFFDAMVCGPAPRWLIENRFLCDYRLFTPHLIDTSVLGKRGHDYRQDQAAALMGDPKIVGDVLAHYRTHAHNTRAIAFCVSVERSRAMAQKFTEAGYPAVHLDGTTDDTIRDHVMRDFAAGHIRVLCNVDLFGEGYDCPAIETVILLRPTMSLSIYLQQVGRALRMSEGKPYANILDPVGNSDTHGDPDKDRTWELSMSPSGNTGDSDAPSPRICRSCFAKNRPGRPTCKICGEAFPVQSREIDEVDGVLIEKQRQQKLAQEMEQVQQLAQDREGLMFIGKQRGYKDPAAWADQVLENRAKQKRKRA